MKRKFVAVFFVLCIMVCCAIPAFAAPSEVNIWEYADIQVDGLTKVVTIRLPVEWLQTGIFDSGYTIKRTQVGNVSGFDLTSTDFANGNLKVGFAPLGTIRNPFSPNDYNGRLLDLHELPNGSVLHYQLSVEMQAASGQSFSVLRSVFNYGYFNGQGLSNVTREAVPYSSSGNVYTAAHDFVVSDNTKRLFFQHYFEFTTDAPSSRWIFRLDDFVITTSIDALQQLVDATGETNRLLDAVNKKLDDITDYVPQPSDPSGGLGDAFDDAEQEVIDKVETGRVEIDTIIDEFAIYLEEFLPGIVVVSNWLTVLLELKFIRVLLFFSLAFGMCGLFLGVANSFRGKS